MLNSSLFGSINFFLLYACTASSSPQLASLDLVQLPQKEYPAKQTQNNNQTMNGRKREMMFPPKIQLLISDLSVKSDRGADWSAFPSYSHSGEQSLI